MRHFFFLLQQNTGVSYSLCSLFLFAAGLGGHLHPHLAVKPWHRTGCIHWFLLAYCHLQDTAVGTLCVGLYIYSQLIMFFHNHVVCPDPCVHVSMSAQLHYKYANKTCAPKENNSCFFCYWFGPPLAKQPYTALSYTLPSVNMACMYIYIYREVSSWTLKLTTIQTD